MKVYVCVALTIIVLLGFAFATDYWLNHSTAAIEANLNGLTADIESGDWKKAKKSLQECCLSWESYSDHWPMIIDYTEISHIELSFEELSYAVKNEDAYEAGKAAVNIQYWLSYIRIREKTNLDNIF